MTRYLILTKWGYPGGGGEQFMYDTMRWAHLLNYEPYWISFNKFGNEEYDKTQIIESEYGTLIYLSGGYNKKNIINWIKLLSPHFIHHQGTLREELYSMSKELRINFLTGFHFWNGAILLDPSTYNENILENSHKHKMDPQLKLLWDEPYIFYYSVTKFVSDCINKVTGYHIEHIINASSSSELRILNGNDSIHNNYITIINIHKKKGGEILLHLLENVTDVPFLVIKTENCSEDLDDLIKKRIDYNNANYSVQSIFLERQLDMSTIYNKTRILVVPTLVDETFCRVVNEGMMNGIPIITTGKGNIKYLVKDNGIIIGENELDKWCSIVSHLYHNKSLLIEYSTKSLVGYRDNSEEIAINQFEAVTTKLLGQIKNNNVMILCPWCDQGLGIQSRNYYNILKDHYNVSIFSFKPYITDSAINLQKNKNEWIVENNQIYYSSNNREDITDLELLKFIEKYNIGKCIIPETCWHRIFEIANFLKTNNVLCYAVPNIEIVEKGEIFKHRYFDKILCNNYLCKNIFESYGFQNTSYVGYCIDEPMITFMPTQYSKNINFLFIGGMNAFSRKHITEICEGFVLACELYDNIYLTCTIQKTNLLEINDKINIQKYMEHPKIKIIQEHLKYADIIELYYNSHISLQLSKHEGLGLGFYEAIMTGTPVITLDTPPHNEIITNNINGWTINCFYKTMTDNRDPLFGSAYFDPIDLRNKINELVPNFANIYKTILITLENNLRNENNLINFKKRFIECINN